MINLHIATGEYCFADVPFEGTNEEAIVEAQHLQQYALSKGLTSEEFNSALEGYLTSQKMANGAEIWEKMSPWQRAVFQELKKAFKRMEVREEADRLTSERN